MVVLRLWVQKLWSRRLPVAKALARPCLRVVVRRMAVEYIKKLALSPLFRFLIDWQGNRFDRFLALLSGCRSEAVRPVLFLSSSLT